MKTKDTLGNVVLDALCLNERWDDHCYNVVHHTTVQTVHHHTIAQLGLKGAKQLHQQIIVLLSPKSAPIQKTYDQGYYSY